MPKPTAPSPSPKALLIAGTVPCDPRTAERALREGVHVIRTRHVRDAIARAAEDLGIALPHSEARSA